MTPYRNRHPIEIDTLGMGRCTIKLFRTVEKSKIASPNLVPFWSDNDKTCLHTCICGATTLQRHTWQVDYRKPTKLISKRSRTIATSYSHHSPPSLVGGCRWNLAGKEYKKRYSCSEAHGQTTPQNRVNVYASPSYNVHLLFLPYRLCCIAFTCFRRSLHVSPDKRRLDCPLMINVTTGLGCIRYILASFRATVLCDVGARTGATRVGGTATSFLHLILYVLFLRFTAGLLRCFPYNHRSIYHLTEHRPSPNWCDLHTRWCS